MIAFVLAAAITSAQPCPTPNPGAGFVCINGGWLPPGHPSIPLQQPRPEPPQPPPPAPQLPIVLTGFQVGRTYRREATGTVLHITALGTTKSGFAVYAAECLNEGVQDQCFFPGEGRFILANALTLGWVEVP